MTNEDKLNILCDYENMELYPKLDKKEFDNIFLLSKDRDPFVRSQAASLLVMFRTKSSRKRLLELAFDKDAFVRCEAYDSLGIFNDKVVELILKNAIIYEKNYLACYYAILSWTDIVKEQKHNSYHNYTFIRRMEQSKRIRTSEHCQMACWNAMYFLGNRNVLRKIVAFLDSENYQVRCATVKHLKEIAEDKRYRKYIVKAIKKRYLLEKTVAVRSGLEQALRELEE